LGGASRINPGEPPRREKIISFGFDSLGLVGASRINPGEPSLRGVAPPPKLDAVKNSGE
jgi:hypothetical protein